jgi:tRNA (uracil-5-)-methyltransferase TRM9
MDPGGRVAEMLIPSAFIILIVDAELVNQLLEINRRFYSQFSADFSDSRSSERLNIEVWRAYLSDNIRLLDVGCGNGRLAEALERAGYTLDYLGIDNSPELIAIAEKNCAGLQHVRARFKLLDITTPNWAETLRASAPFDLVAALAVLHHIPGFDLRANVLRAVHTLLKPGGLVVLSNWQFLNDERSRKKLASLDGVLVEKLMLSSRLEPGDYILDWKRGGVGYRYVHLVTEAEVENLARGSGFKVIEQFLADADLNLFSILEREC